MGNDAAPPTRVAPANHRNGQAEQIAGRRPPGGSRWFVAPRPPTPSGRRRCAQRRFQPSTHSASQSPRRPARVTPGDLRTPPRTPAHAPHVGDVGWHHTSSTSLAVQSWPARRHVSSGWPLLEKLIVVIGMYRDPEIAPGWRMFAVPDGSHAPSSGRRRRAWRPLASQAIQDHCCHDTAASSARLINDRPTVPCSIRVGMPPGALLEDAGVRLTSITSQPSSPASSSRYRLATPRCQPAGLNQGRLQYDRQ